MFTSTLRRKAVGAVLGVASAGLALGSAVVGTPVAHADPKQFSALVGVGSDTIQDVTNALAGNSNGINYTPITSDTTSGNVQITSWNATGTSCITPKAPGATINRPNGSGAGRKALSRAIDGTTWGDTTCGSSSTGKPTSGLVDFARSSAGPTAGDTGTALTYVPIGRDGVTFAYYAPGVASPVTSLSRSQLTAIYTAPSSTPVVISGITILPCGIQTSSGTYSFWNTVTTASAGQEDTATTTCNTAGTGARIEENTASSLAAKGDALASSTTEVIVGFSAGQYIAQQNGRSVNTFTGNGANVHLGSISDNGSGTVLGSPFSGTAPNLQPVGTFYNDAVFGRNVYVVLDTNRATGVGNGAIKTLFVGSSSAVCSTAAQSTINLFGFLTPSNCGATTIQGSLLAGNI